MNRSKFFSLILSVVAMSSSASAAITLIDPAVNNTFIEYQQTTQNPCVIGDASCHQPAGFSYTLLDPNVSAYDALSPIYTASQITGLVGNTNFGLGLDLNNTGSNQTVTLVQMMIGGSVSNGVLSGGDSSQKWQSTWTNKALNNGTGYSDLNFLGFNLQGISGSTNIQFRLVMPTVNDGRENLFLISGTTVNSVPEPSSMALIGTGLAGLGFLARRRKK